MFQNNQLKCKLFLKTTYYFYQKSNLLIKVELLEHLEHLFLILLHYPYFHSIKAPF